jgi:hypothetical protein
MLAFKLHKKRLATPLTLFFMIGGPGSGKGALAGLAKERCTDMHLVHLSIGQLLRDAVKEYHRFGGAIHSAMTDGEHVSNEIVVELLGVQIRRARYRANQEAWGHAIVLLDGFPVTETQLTVFTQMLQLDNKVPRHPHCHNPNAADRSMCLVGASERVTRGTARALARPPVSANSRACAAAAGGGLLSRLPRPGERVPAGTCLRRKPLVILHQQLK